MASTDEGSKRLRINVNKVTVGLVTGHSVNYLRVSEVSMFRFLLTTYLCLGAAFAPLLCCCALQHHSTTPSTGLCCHNSAADSARKHDHHRGEHQAHHRHDGDNGHGSAAQVATDKEQPGDEGTSKQPDPDSCPCGKQLLKLATVSTPKAQFSSGDITTTWLHLLFVLPVSAVSDATDVASAASHRFRDGPPVSLAGRDMLRAYQIMRC